MNRIEALRQVVESLHAEIAALKRFDVAALAEATDAKQSGLGVIAGPWDAADVDDEVRALENRAPLTPAQRAALPDRQRAQTAPPGPAGTPGRTDTEDDDR